MGALALRTLARTRTTTRQEGIGLDTGCVYGYQLTAYIIETDDFVSVSAHDTYDPS